MIIAAVPYELGSVIAVMVQVEAAEQKIMGLQETVSVRGLT